MALASVGGIATTPVKLARDAARFPAVLEYAKMRMSSKYGHPADKDILVLPGRVELPGSCAESLKQGTHRVVERIAGLP
jgi:hypothetical protein